MEKTSLPPRCHLAVTANASGKDLVVVSSPLHLRLVANSAPDIALPPNGKIPQAPKPGHKTRQRQSKNADKDIELGCTPSRSDFESTTAAEQLAISQMRPAKRPVSEELQDEEDEQAFEKDFQEQTAKGKKGKGKKSNIEGPFKSGPIPEQAQQRAFAIHASFEKQIQDLATTSGNPLWYLIRVVTAHK
ncbi:hypothetical protein DXG01_010047 [Tephrocybe rancida]|nr:hypothetical protein DXG01_010047 [Tephrocybe rancida]